MVAEAFDGCTACSSRAVAAYISRGAGFVLDALRDPRSLEALDGAGRAARVSGGDGRGVFVVRRWRRRGRKKEKKRRKKR